MEAAASADRAKEAASASADKAREAGAAPSDALQPNREKQAIG